jgi:GMP synthase-like glutamine amidotransferase
MKILSLDLDDAKAWKERPFSSMFADGPKCDSVGGIRVPGDEWVVKNLALGDELQDDTTDGFDVVILSGSRYNCRDKKPWMDKVYALVRSAAQRGAPKVWGVCLGHQLIATALNGVVDKNPDHVGFVCKCEKITCTEAFDVLIEETGCNHLLDCCCRRGTCDATKGNSGALELNLLDSHGDCVRELPPGATLLASSSSCSNEMFLAGTRGNIMGVQSHPEFDLDFCIRERIFPAICKNKRLSEEGERDAMESFAAYDQRQAAAYMQVVRAWMERDGPSSSSSS